MVLLYLKSQSIPIAIGILWLFALESLGQVISGQVLSLTDNTPIPYASITTQKHLWGLNAGEDGVFILEDADVTNNFNEGDTLLINSLGYYETRVSYRELHDKTTLYLRERPIQLDEVKIRNDARFTDIWLGSKLQSTSSGTGHPSYQNMQEIALWIPNLIQSEGYINKVGYWIMSSGKPKTPFRVRIYEYDHGMPGKDLLKQNIVTHARRGSEWVDVDVSEHNIPFPKDGFFVSMEWLLVPDKKYYFDVRWPDGRTTKEYGQGAGTTREFASGYGRIRNNSGQWEAYKYKNNPRPMFRAQVRIYE